MSPARQMMSTARAEKATTTTRFVVELHRDLIPFAIICQPLCPVRVIAHKPYQPATMRRSYSPENNVAQAMQDRLRRRPETVSGRIGGTEGLVFVPSFSQFLSRLS